MRVAYFDIMPTPYKTWFSVCVTAALFMGIPSIIGHFLDKATAHQCLTHDWPTHLHQNHLDFCDEFGYPTKS